jgi:hypothetical protein
MSKLFPYFAESGICLLVFFTLYHALFKRETFYSLNRVYLVFSMAFSLLVPLLHLHLQTPSIQPMAVFRMDPLTVTAQGRLLPVRNGLSPAGILGIIYIVGLSLLIIRMLHNLYNIHRLYRKGRKIPGDGYRLVLHSEMYPPFSFFRYIFISEKHYSENEMEDILEHEKTHIRQMHTVDLILAELLILLQWFNPMVWLYKKLVTENHEFLADEAVLNRGFSPETYRLRIVAELFGIRSMPTVHNFNQSITKKRLKMMEKSKSTAASRLKLLLVMPTAMMLFYLFACSTVPSDPETKITPEVKQVDVFIQVDVAAEPEGGIKAFQQYIARNIKYPEEAREKGVQGKIYIQFVVDEKGNLVKAVQSSEVPPPPPPVKDAVEAPAPPPVPDTPDDIPPPPPPADKIVLEGIVVVGYRPPEGVKARYDPADIQLLANEAVRVISESNLKWKPALNDGKPVKSAWTIPIQFKLD